MLDANLCEERKNHRTGKNAVRIYATVTRRSLVAIHIGCNEMNNYEMVSRAIALFESSKTHRALQAGNTV